MSDPFPDRTRNSMLVWYPLIENKLPTPKTIMIELDFEYVIEYLDGKNGLEKHKDEIFDAAKNIGYPLFIRCDQTSDKHNWLDTCYVQKEEELLNHFYKICEFSYMADVLGLPVKAIILREFLQLKSIFKAFNGMPVAREFRCFATDGKIDCIHPYWFEEAIEFEWDIDELNRAKKGLSVDEQIELGVNPPEPHNWRIKLDAMNVLWQTERLIITSMVEKASKLVGGKWSIDVCNTTDNKWYITDMAIAEQSYHHPHKVKEEK